MRIRATANTWGQTKDPNILGESSVKKDRGKTQRERERGKGRRRAASGKQIFTLTI